MDARALRNNVEEIAARIERGEDGWIGQAFLTFGQTFVGIYEELAGIRRALEGTHDPQEPPR